MTENQADGASETPLVAVRESAPIVASSERPLSGDLPRILKETERAPDDTYITISLGDLRRLMKLQASVESLMGRFRDAVEKARR